MQIQLQQFAPSEIEKRSMAIIQAELGEQTLEPNNAAVIKRVIHTTADFDYLNNLYFSPEAVAQGCAFIKKGCSIITDTQMAKAGINKKALEKLGIKTYCFIADKDVSSQAKSQGITRAAVAMERAVQLSQELGPCIFVIGNAPTALIRLYESIQIGVVKPALVIGVPVGFVNVVEAKELIMTCSIPQIVARGRKGGSNVAAAICNALLYQVLESELEKTDG